MSVKFEPAEIEWPCGNCGRVFLPERFTWPTGKVTFQKNCATCSMAALEKFLSEPEEEEVEPNQERKTKP